MNHLTLSSPVGPLTLFEDDGAIVAVEFGKAPPGDGSPLLETARRQLNEYFDGERLAFDLPLAPAGTPFRQAVWKRMLEIPAGEVRTYGWIAQRLHSSPRAVGGACGANPIPIIIPCHRVVGAGGRMTGYSGGEGVETKRRLLAIEGYAFF